MEILVRNLSEEDGKILTEKAKAAGATDRAAWLTEQLHNMAVMPERYAFRVYGQSGGKGGIRRHSDHPNGTGSTFSNFSQNEADAMRRAEDFVRRNGPGDRERAFSILVECFGADKVFEAPM